MFIPQAHKLAQTTAQADLLTSQPPPTNSTKSTSSFDNMLQQSFKTPDRPASPVEARRPETRATEPKRADTQRSGRESNPSTNKASTSKSDTSEQRPPADSANAAQIQTETNSSAKAPADQDSGATTTEAATAETAATGPASFAVLSSIIAALSNAVPTEAKLAGSAGTAVAVDAPIEDALGLPGDKTAGSTTAPLEGDLLADPKRKLVALAGEGAGNQAASGETDEADTLLPKLPVSGDEGDGATTKPAASEAKPLIGPANTTQPASLTQANGAATTAPAVNGLQGELTAGALNANGIGGPHRAESQNVQQLPVYTPAGNKAWAEDVGNRLIWMANRSESRAELMLTPPSLGKLGVSIQVSGDQTTAQFVAATPAAREALEQAMPRLRELLQQAGINLGQTDVSTSGDQQAREGANREGRDPAGRGGGSHGVAEAEAERAISTSWSTGGNGVIDIFA